METISHSGYHVSTEGERVTVNYRKSAGEWVQAVLQLAMGIALTSIPVFVILDAESFKLGAGMIIGLVFLIILMLMGLSKLAIALEILFRPTHNVFVADKKMKRFSYRLTFFRKRNVYFDDIRSFHLYRDDDTAESLHQGRTFKRKLYSHKLQLKRVDDAIEEVHTFSTRSFFIPLSSEKETYDIRTVSKAIATLLARECGKPYRWLGSNPSD